MSEINTSAVDAMGQTSPPPQSVAVVLTERCNARCIYCPYRNNILHFPEDPPAESLLRLIHEAAAYGVSGFRLSGGEPLLRKDITLFIREARQLSLESSIVTNGSLLNEHRLEELVAAGLQAITLSIDSLIPQTYEYCRGLPFDCSYRALENIRHLKVDHAPVWVGVTVVITRYNVEELPDIARSLSAMEIPVQFQPCHSYSPQHENDHLRPTTDQITHSIDALLRLREEGYLINNSVQYLTGIPTFFARYSPPPGFQCQIPWTLAVFDGDLSLRPCCFLQPPVEHSRGCSLHQAWTSPAMNVWREQIRRGECPGCWLLSLDTWK